MSDQPRPLVFNLSRLASRQHSSTPTGVDRVDLRHARFVLEQSNTTTVVFVYQRKDVLHRVAQQTARQLIDNLWQRWRLSQPEAPLPAANTLQRLTDWARMKFRRGTNTLIAPGIKQALAGQPEPVYINSGQVGVHHLHLHQRLADELNAHIIFYLHDLIPIDYPEYARSLAGAATHRQRMATMAQTATTILTNSEYTQDRFRAYCSQHSLPAPTMDVLPIGVEEHFLEARRKPCKNIPEALASRIQQPYFIVVGTIEPRKNHLLLLHIWRRLASELEDQCPMLVIIGRRGWENENIVDLLERSPAIREHAIELNPINDTDMIALLQNARAMLLPSVEEGWGIPVAEALTLGTPVLCSDIPALRECSQGRASYLDPLDGTGWHEAISAMISTSTNTAASYRPYTWEEHLKQLANQLRQAGR